MFKKNTKINKSKYCKIRKFQLIVFLTASQLMILNFGLEAGQRGRESWQPPDKIMDAVEFLRNLNKYLKPGAPLVIVELDSKQDRSSYPDYMSPDQVLETVKESDFQLDRTETFLPRDTIYIYRLKASANSLR